MTLRAALSGTDGGLGGGPGGARRLPARVLGLMAEHPRLARGGAAALALAYVATHDPHRPSRLIGCPWRAATGLHCPGCGGVRLAHDLLHGDLRSAVHDNPFLLVAGPVLGASAAWGRLRQPGRAAVPPRFAYALGGAAVIWAVVRNLPGWPLKPIVRR